MSNKDDFFDTTELDELDRQLEEQLAKPTLVDKMQEQSDKKEAAKDVWNNELKRNWFVYVILAISALFTGTLGIYMGLSPTLDATANVIKWNTDFGHVMLAIVYLIAFVGTTEYMFAVAKHKYHTREESNGRQRTTMLIAMGVAGLSIVFTGIAGGMVVASNIAFLTEFVHIPAAAQKWVVVSIPVLLAIYTFLFSAYALSSQEAKSERMTREQERKQELDHRTRMRQIEFIAERKLQVEEFKRYKKLVADGLMSAADANAALRAGRTLKQEEHRQRRDIDGDNKIGDVPAPVGASKNGKNYP